MKMVIDIPKETFKYYVILANKGEQISNLERIILDGTPLPDQHGRLKDVDAFISKVKADRKHSIYLRSWTADDVLNALNNNYAPTIIEGSNNK